MLTLSVVFVTIAILIGVYMVMNRAQGKPRYPKWLPLLHLGTVGVGAVLVILAAFSSNDLRLWLNIAIAVIVSILGLCISHGKFSRQIKKALLSAHIFIALGCTLFLIYNTI